MKMRTWFFAGLLTVVGFNLITCVLPSPPPGPEKADVGLLLKSVNGISDMAITDAVGNNDTIGLVLNLTHYIDSTIITVTKGDSLEHRFVCTAKKTTVDTIYYVVSFPSIGDRNVTATGYITGQPNSVASATIHIVDRSTGNQKPVLKVPGTRVVIAGETLTFQITATDPDNNHTVTVIAEKKPEAAVFSNNTFSWVTTLADVGKDTLVFSGRDDGVPAMTDTDSVFVVISATPVNRPPEWNYELIQFSGRPETPLSLSLSDKCTDSDKDALSFELIAGSPDGDVISGSTWQYTPAAGDTGIFAIRVIVLDPDKESDTMTIELTVNPNAVVDDKTPPSITFISPPRDSFVVSSPSYQISLVCEDESGIKSVSWVTGSDTTLFTKEKDSLYSAVVGALNPSSWTTIRLIATDASPSALMTVVDMHLKYDPSVPDNVQPVITLVSPSTDTTIDADSCPVNVKCTDESGVASVVLVVGTDTTAMAAGPDNLFTGTARHLTAGAKTTITISAVDSSTTRNRKSITLSVRFDNDVTGPAITLIVPDKDSVTTNSSSFKATLQCTDASGVLSVNGAMGAARFAGVRENNNRWAISINGLAGGLNTIVFTATDSSLRANTMLDTVYISSVIVNGYTVTFDKNDAAATGTMAAQTIASGVSAPLASNAFSKAGSTFAGWMTSASGTTVAYTDGAAYTMGTANVTLYAKWTTNNYTVTFDKNDVAATGSMATQTIASGASAPLTANAFTKTGATFAGWMTNATGTTVVYTDGVAYTMGTTNVTLYAKWTTNNYTVTFNKNDAAATGTMAAQIIASGASAPLTTNAFVKTGSTFAGWMTSATGTTVAYADGAAFTMGTANVTLYAQWTQNPHTVTFDKNDAAASGNMAVQTIGEGSSAALMANAFTKTGYSFAGWMTTAAGPDVAYTDGALYTMGTANVTLYAKWTVIGCTVTFNSQNGSAVASQTVNYNTLATQPAAPTRACYTFGGWYKEAACTNPWDFTTDVVTGATTLYARWTINQVTVTFDVQGGSAVASQSVTCGTSATQPAAPTLACNTFGGWYKEAACTNPWSFTTDVASAATTLYARWTSLGPYTMTFNSQGGSSVTSQSVACGGTATQPVAPTLSCNTFGGWFKEAACTNPWSFTADVVTGATTVFARWTPLGSYTVTFNSQGGSTVTSQSVACGGTVTQPASPTRSCYTFGGWYKEAACTNLWSFTTDEVMGATTLFARWTGLGPYTVSFNSLGGSSVASQSVSCGGTVTQPASPSQYCYTFGGWYKEAACTNPWSFTTDVVTATTTLYARWTALGPYTVSFNSQGGSTVSSQSVACGGYATNTASPSRSCYTFGGWYKEASCINAWSFSTDVVTATTTLWARWSILGPYTVYFNSQGGSSVSSQSAYCGEYVSNPGSPSRNCYTFGGWYKESSCVNPWSFSSDVVTATTTLWARWTGLGPYTVSFNSQGGSSVGSQSISCGNLVTNPAPPARTCYTFGGWYRESSYINPWSFSSDVPTSNMTLYARWTVTPISVTLANGQSTTTYSGYPIICTNNPSACASYEWHFQAFMGDQTITTCGPTHDFENCTTNALTVHAQTAMTIWCFITDINGTRIRTGDWNFIWQW